MSAPQQPSYGQPGFNQPAQGQSRMVAGLLNFFFGGIGAGDFYLGHTKVGLAKIAALVVSYALVIIGTANNITALATIGSLLVFAFGLFVFVCMILTFMGKWIYAQDGKGVPTV